jgi:hypothetical protein
VIRQVLRNFSVGGGLTWKFTGQVLECRMDQDEERRITSHRLGIGGRGMAASDILEHPYERIQTRNPEDTSIGEAVVEPLWPGEVLIRCLACGRSLVADGGWPKIIEIRCSCGVLCSSTQPLFNIPPSSLDKPCRPIRKHHSQHENCSRPNPPPS